ncbi:MAG: hypothetical protein QOF89_5518, partial [Acidobacteriota bacterium]|nr:hypothetical protein [Acidobacteriota bacterium]
DLGTVYVAPRTALEEVLAGIWCEVLRIERVGIQDNFFTLGGHSLLATQVVSRVREAFGVELALRSLFEKPTVAALALEIESLRSGERRFQAPPLKPVAREGDLPLSFAQERLWFLDQLRPGLTAYNVPALVRLVGRLAVDALVEALREIVRRHEALRTVFHLPAGEDEPVQAILPAAAVPLPLVDLSAVPPASREAEARRLAAVQTRRPFDLARGPLLRAVLLRLAGPEDPQGSEHVLLLSLHHIVTDGWSMGVLMREVAALYGAFSAGLPSPLPELPVQYADYATWQRDWLAGEVLAAQIAYWRDALAGVPPLLDLPTDRPRPPVQTFRGAHRTTFFPPELAEPVRQLGRSRGLTTFMVLLAALQTLLHRNSGQGVVAVGSPTANRGRVELEGLIGFFANTLVLAADLTDDPGFCDLLARVREVALGAYAHQDLPFEKLVEELAPERNLAHSPLFQVLFVFQGAAAPASAPQATGSLALSPLEADAGTAKFDLNLEMSERGRGFAVTLEYNTDLFETATAARLLRGFETLLAGAVADPARPLSTLPLLSRTQEHQLTHEWNDSSAGFPGDTCLYRWFAAQADRTPGAVAVAFEGETLTYGELDARAGRLARRLRGLGVGPEVRVGICVERSLEMMVGLLGILAAGGAYVPLDPSYPADRLAFMLADSQQGLELPVLLTQARLLDTLPAHGARVICLDLPLPEGLDADLLADLWPSNLAYVIYTSGSTGRPKGTMNSHRGIVNRLLWMQEEYGLTADDRVLQKTPISFDVSVWELFWPLMVGARLVIARPGGHQDGAYLAGLIAEQGITTLHFVPSMLQVFLDSPGLDRCASLRRVIASGEALPADLVSRFFAQLGGSGAGLYNLYGPTEAAVDVTVWTCERYGRRASVPIGRPIANTRIHLLDRHLATTPLGVPGELHIGGVQVGRGYLNRPELTAESFIPDPFAGVPGARLYKTGDLARHLPDGAVEFLGRLDHQVKIRGFRIELGEIEAALAAHPDVREAVVVARERAAGGALGDWRLTAYVVGRGGVELAPEAEELRGFLRSRLPAHMVPWAFVVLPALPLNANGKIDRRALPDPERSAWGAAAGIEEPQSEMERTIAAIWRELLRLDPVGIDDNFFDSGGHSLLAVRVHNQLRRLAGREFPLVALFEHPTIRALARYLEAGEAGEASPASRLRGQDRGAKRREAAGRRRPGRPAPLDHESQEP